MTTYRWPRAATAGLLAVLGACSADPQAPDFPMEGVTGKLAITTSVVLNPPHTQDQLRIMDLATGSANVIYTGPVGEYIGSITWHPSGQSLVFATAYYASLTDPVVYRLRRVNVDGTGLASSFEGEGPEASAAYSPQGSLAYWARQMTLAVEGLYIDGGLIWEAGHTSSAPSWFPDGSAVAVVANDGLYRVARATKVASPILMASAEVGNFWDPAVSPEGDVIAVTAASADGWHILLLGLDGSIRAVLPEGYAVQWSPDASRIIYLKNGQPYVRELATGEVRQLPKMTVGAMAWFP